MLENAVCCVEIGRSQAYWTPSTFQASGRQRLGSSEGTGVDPLGHVELGPLVVVAHQGHDVGHRELLVGRQRKRIGLRAGLAAMIVGRKMLRRGRTPQNAPHAGVAHPPRQRRRRAVGLVEAKRLARLRIVPAVADGEALHVFRVEPVGRIVAGDLADAGLVGVAGNLSVGDAAGGPDRTLAAGARADDLQNPCLLGIGDRDRLALIGVAVLVDELGHHLDRLAGGAGPLQRERHQKAVSQQPLRIFQLLSAAEGGLGQGELMFVDQAAEHLIGMRNLRDFAGAVLDLVVARFDRNHFARLVVGGGENAECGKAPGTIAGGGNHHRAVGRSAAGDQNARTCSRRHRDEDRSRHNEERQQDSREFTEIGEPEWRMEALHGCALTAGGWAEWLIL